MPDFGILFVLILISAIPAIAVFLWFRLARYAFTSPMFFLSLFAGASSLFVALVLQYFVAGLGILPPFTDRAGLFAEIFVRIAFTEELARLFLLVPLFLVFRRFGLAGRTGRELGAGTMGTASGLVAGLGFGVLESAVYAASYPGNLLLRAFTSTLLHAACGARVGFAAAAFRERPSLAVLRFLSAVAIHGVYNLMIAAPARHAPFVAVFLAFFALASSVQSIIRGMKEDEE